MQPRPNLIASEEVEHGLDPWTLRAVLAALRQASQEGVQVLLTSQSPVVLDEMDPEEVLHMRRDKGEAVYECMADFEKVSRKDGGMKPGAMWLTDYMGEGRGRREEGGGRR
ncbi:RecF/RecN/SMC N terminal domain, putative [Chondromyces apiculatus DSM 436]|uniref:RecF/RecN/SMC N terminal domain, putative n=1 Tax=Chondromyces apiculatus DSM 436 TaxID=1192034 RepID=A0A017TIJ4_9BACT|nr:RecF/RecN/SMC N terminal domain, putative [Chondromyces apiculatus DSM 436]